METPPEIQFQGMQGTPQIEEMIAAHIAELDSRGKGAQRTSPRRRPL
jgi:hypothetical protein